MFPFYFEYTYKDESINKWEHSHKVNQITIKRVIFNNLER